MINKHLTTNDQVFDVFNTATQEINKNSKLSAISRKYCYPQYNDTRSVFRKVTNSFS